MLERLCDRAGAGYVACWRGWVTGPGRWFVAFEYIALQLRTDVGDERISFTEPLNRYGQVRLRGVRGRGGVGSGVLV